MTYNSRRQATPSFIASKPRRKASPRITFWDVIGLLVLMALGAWVLYVFSGAILLTLWGRWGS